MTSARLTKSIRISIVREILKDRFLREINQLQTDRAELADKIYHDLYDDETITEMYSKPTGWFSEEEDLRAQFGEGHKSYQSLNFNGEIHIDSRIGGWNAGFSIFNYQDLDVENKQTKRFLDKHAGGCIKAYAVTSKMYKLFDKHRDKVNDLEKRIKESGKKAFDVLNSVTTFKRAKEVWPEASAYISRFEPGADYQLPAVVFDMTDLNKVLNLP